MKSRFESIQIRAIGTVLPGVPQPLVDLGPDFGVDYVRRVVASTGIESVHIAPTGVTSSDLCVIVARELIQREGLTPEDFDALVFVTQSPDYITPATSPSIQARLGMRTDVAAMDLNFGCSGYVYGLLQASLLCLLPDCRRVMLLVGDIQTPYVNLRDRSLKMVIGDGASATIVEKGTQTAVGVHYSDGSGVEHLYIPAGGRRRPYSPESLLDVLMPDGGYRSDLNLRMDGAEILRFAMETVPEMIEGIVGDAGWTKDEVDLFVLHQANKLILESIRRKIGVPKEKLPVMLRTTGNTSPTSIPLALSKMVEAGEIPDSMSRVVLCGFGIGLSYGAIAANLTGCRIYPPIYS
ncbi:MAG: ketoacyl-ACP synthase III [Fimbriimonas sp.]|nr:ketoacyl-ACP synthase III [Fimbriimonas sp.]